MTEQKLVGSGKTRILGDQRIFQSVFNDLKMTHEEVTLSDGRKVWAYVYEGIDPYELEDSAFPSTVAAIQAYANERVMEQRKKTWEEIYHIHMAHDWNEMSPDIKDWLCKEQHDFLKLAPKEEES